MQKHPYDVSNIELDVWMGGTARPIQLWEEYVLD